MGYLFVDTGAFYRMVTYLIVQAGKPLAEEVTVLALARQSVMDLSPYLNADGRQYTALLDGHDVTFAIRSKEVEGQVSRVAAMPRVRQMVNDLQRDVALRGNVIMAGRDIGTVVMPDADLKFYLDATPEARGKRRYDEIIGRGGQADLNQIIQDLRDRDRLDSTRSVAPLRQPSDAIYIDSSTMSLNEVIAYVKHAIETWKIPALPRSDS
jgi:cytidylate kinase